MSLNTWHHLVATYDDAGDRKVHFYLDGTEVTYGQQDAVTGTLTDDSAYELVLGATSPGVGSYFTGSIDEVRIYDEALSADAVLALSREYRNTSTFVYDGDGNRGKKLEGGETVLYINQYYEKNLTTSVVTTHYYLGGRQVAIRQGTTLTYVHQDHLTGTALLTDDNGDVALAGVECQSEEALLVGQVQDSVRGRHASVCLFHDGSVSGRAFSRTTSRPWERADHTTALRRAIAGESMVGHELHPASARRLSG